uniref:Antitoxin MazE n=1 Tax=Candidatus Kentrum sp. DK TaxID=2126562 RepID=A0A450S182_9GAMM|nr:MAG: antitoxin MazE [Candidatus Kentron sp. DK]
MVQLVKIGNSQGVRIPRPLVEQAHLEGKELTIRIVTDGVLITPEQKVGGAPPRTSEAGKPILQPDSLIKSSRNEKAPRKGWAQAIEQTILAQGTEAIDDEWLDAPLDSDEDPTWRW